VRGLHFLHLWKLATGIKSGIDREEEIEGRERDFHQHFIEDSLILASRSAREANSIKLQNNNNKK